MPWACREGQGLGSMLSSPSTSRPLVPVGLSAASGGRQDVVVTVQSDDHSLSQTWGVLASDPGWTLHMVCHFHYDPVWWNSQANYTEDWPEPVKAAHPYLDCQAAACDVVSAH